MNQFQLVAKRKGIWSRLQTSYRLSEEERIALKKQYNDLLKLT